MRSVLVLAWVIAALGPSYAQQVPEPQQSRLGINLAGLSDWNTELPFVDVFHLARAWISQRQGEKWGGGPPLELDERGWVKRLEPGCWADTLLCNIAGGHYPGGESSRASRAGSFCRWNRPKARSSWP